MFQFIFLNFYVELISDYLYSLTFKYQSMTQHILSLPNSANEVYQNSNNFHLKGKKQKEVPDSSNESSDSLFVPNIRNKQKTIFEYEKPSKSRKRGRWDSPENIKYIDFLKKYKQTLGDPILRKKKKIFNSMSTKINGRTADQCRGHHLKFLKKHRSIDRIIQNYSRIIDQNNIMSKLNTKLKSKEDIANKNTVAIYEDQPTQEFNKIRITILFDRIKSWQTD